jgi:hypothetical protein
MPARCRQLETPSFGANIFCPCARLRLVLVSRFPRTGADKSARMALKGWREQVGDAVGQLGSAIGPNS